MKATVVIPPPEGIIIELTREEARILGGVCGSIGGNNHSKVRLLTDEIYNKIKNELFNGSLNKIHLEDLDIISPMQIGK